MPTEHGAERELTLAGGTILLGIGPELSVEPYGSGAVLSTSAPSGDLPPRCVVHLGTVPGLRRLVCCYRYEPHWMKPCVAERLEGVPSDTQYALLDTERGYVLIVPLVEAPYRASLKGHDGKLRAVIESGSPHATAGHCRVAYIARGQDVHSLIRQAAREVCALLQLGRLREDKPLPDFVDLFGWCTWDAYYREVSPKGVHEGLQSFEQGGVQPRFVILDDGWQSVTSDTNEARLSSFSANEKFSHTLSNVIALAKRRFGVRRFLVWHTIHGYWSGADPESFAEYGVRRVPYRYSPEVLAHAWGMNPESSGGEADCPAPERLDAFYDDYHRSLAEQGVDGVKVDNQSSVEGLSHDVGGRVENTRVTRRALEKSAERRLAGRLINCMSCSTEMLYLMRDSTLTRTSTDFWPHHPESHGLHLYTNALVSLWFGEFVHPDWDMFQSGHPAGTYHASARAISGGPVYVSDKPQGHDFELLRKLVLPDGSIPRALDIARPTLDCVFVDPTAGNQLLKLYNRNVNGFVIGLFNAHYEAGREALIAGQVGFGDLPVPPHTAPAGERQAYDAFATSRVPSGVAIYETNANRLRLCTLEAKMPITLGPLHAELVTLVPAERGLAVIGVLGYLNIGGTIAEQSSLRDLRRVRLRSHGTLLAFSRERPAAVHCGGRTAHYSFDALSGRLEVDVPEGAELNVEIRLPG